MDFCFRFWVAGVGQSAAKETPGFRSYLTPTPATLTKLTIIHERTHVVSFPSPIMAIARWRDYTAGLSLVWTLFAFSTKAESCLSRL